MREEGERERNVINNHDDNSRPTQLYRNVLITVVVQPGHVLNTFPSDPIRPRPRRGKRVCGGGGLSILLSILA